MLQDGRLHQPLQLLLLGLCGQGWAARRWRHIPPMGRPGRCSQRPGTPSSRLPLSASGWLSQDVGLFHHALNQHIACTVLGLNGVAGKALKVC